MRRRLLAVLLLTVPAGPSVAQDPSPRLDLYGYVMLDMGYQVRQSNPDYFDVMRPTQLPAFENEFGADGRTYFSVRQTRFGIRGFIPTALGELRTLIEFDLFGSGTDVGQTTFHLRHAYGELGHFGAGKTVSPFQDIDGFPTSIEFWGPNGLVAFRNLQARWMPVQGDTRVTVALLQPGGSADEGVVEGRIELEDVRGRFPLPDVSAEYRQATGFGYIEIAGIVRYMKWDDLNTDAFDLSGDATGWGVNLSSNIHAGRGVFRLQAVYGEGVENYMNDAPVDIGVQSNPGSGLTPVTGEALPVFGFSGFYDHAWDERWSSALGYSVVDIDNTDLQLPSAFKRGHYALANLLYRPVPGVLTGGEVIWGRRENFRDGWTADDVRVQFSFKWNFRVEVGGKDG
jgi:hypothetical protein